MKKLMLLVAAGAGYVLGARAGRERYDAIADQANKLWTDPRVQEKVEEVKTKAPEVAHKVSEEAKAKAHDVKAKVSGQEMTTSDGTYSNDTGTVTSDGALEVDTTGFGPGGEKLP